MIKHQNSNSTSFEDEDMDFFDDDVMGDAIAEYTHTSSSPSHKKYNKSNKKTRTSIAQASQRIQAEHQESHSSDSSNRGNRSSKPRKRPHSNQNDSKRSYSGRATSNRQSSRQSSSSEDVDYEEYLNDDFDDAFEQETNVEPKRTNRVSSRKRSSQDSYPLSNADDFIEDTDESTEEIDSFDATEKSHTPSYQEYLQEEIPDNSSADRIEETLSASNSYDVADSSVTSAAMSRKEPVRSARKDEPTQDTSNNTSQKRWSLKKGTGNISRDEMMQIRHSFEDIILRSFILVIERSQPLHGGTREPRVKTYLLTGGTLADCFLPKCFSYDTWEWYVDGTTHDFYFEGTDKKRGKLSCQYRRVNKATTVEQLKKLMDKIQNNNPYEISFSARTSDLGSTILKYFVVEE